jgi:hypothetical protein
VRVDVADWSDWLNSNLSSWDAADHLVPYHWAPHLLRGWLEREVERQGGRLVPGGTVAQRGLPMERDSAAGDRALSYADWICPVTCIEPALCPHTRGPKDWSLAEDLLAVPPGAPFADALVFPCLHFVYGVGTVPVATILRARDRLLAGIEHGPRSWLVSTSSHCHALARVLRVEPAAPPA